MKSNKNSGSLVRPVMVVVIAFLVAYVHDYLQYRYFANWKRDMEFIRECDGAPAEEILAAYDRVKTKWETNKKGKTLVFFKSQINTIRYVVFQEMCIADEIAERLKQKNPGQSNGKATPQSPPDGASSEASHP